MTPREKVSNLLEALGFDIQADDIVWVKGAHSHNTHDVLERWRANGYKDGKAIEITGLDSVTECARGLTVEVNEPGSQYYGDFTCAAVKNPVKSNPPSSKRFSPTILLEVPCVVCMM